MYKSLNSFFFSFFFFLSFSIKSYLCWKSYHSSVHSQNTWAFGCPILFFFLCCISTSHINCSKRLWLPPSSCSATLFDSRYWVYVPSNSGLTTGCLERMYIHTNMFMLPCLVSLIWFVRPGVAFCPRSPFPFKSTKAGVSKKRENIMTTDLS